MAGVAVKPALEKAGDVKISIEDIKKNEEIMEQKLKETQVSIPRFTPHNVPDCDLERTRESFMWSVKIFPFSHGDSKNCVLDAATKIAHKALYYIHKHKSGQGIAELFMTSNKEAIAIMGRIVHVPFYHRYVNIELTRRGQEVKKFNAPYKKIEETATLVLDSTRCEKIRSTVASKDGQKSLWVRYLSENTSPEFLQVLFPLSQKTEVQTHDNLRVGLVEANSKTNLIIFIKAYATVIINGVSVLSLHTIEPTDKESKTKADLEKALLALGELKQVPTDAADKQNQRREDKNETARVLKRTMHQQHMGDQPPAKRDRGEPAARGGVGSWGDSRWSGSGRFASGVDFRGFGGQLNPQAVTAEMMMMQARLNQTLRTQLMMLNPSARRSLTAGFGGRLGGGGGGGANLRGVRAGRIGGGPKAFGGGW